MKVRALDAVWISVTLLLIQYIVRRNHDWLRRNQDHPPVTGLVVCLFTSLTHRFFSESNLFPSRRPTKDTVGTHAEYTSSLNQNSATPSINAHIAMVKGSLYIYVLCTYVDISIYQSIYLWVRLFFQWFFILIVRQFSTSLYSFINFIIMILPSINGIVIID